MKEMSVGFSGFVHVLVHNLKETKIKIITSREFRDNQKMYFDMVDKNEQIVVKRKNRAYKLVPVTDDDMLVDIPKEFRCDPYEVSPSGDMFWADKRNVEKVKKAIEDKEIALRLTSEDEIKNFLDSL